jgi:hypothetical protein
LILLPIILLRSIISTHTMSSFIACFYVSIAGYPSC